MNIDKTDEYSHVTDITDTMLTFLNKEGANSYPTITVLLNRFFLDTDSYDWYKNSGIDVKFPEFKVGDDLHWYKTQDIYKDLKLSINSSILPDCPIFIKNDISELQNFTKFYDSANGFYSVIDKNLYFVKNINSSKKVINITTTSDGKKTTTDFTETILDILSYGTTDFILTSSNLYRYKVDDDEIEKIYSKDSYTFKAFCEINNHIIIATDKGGLVLSNIMNAVALDDTITYDTHTVWSSTSTSGDDDDSSGGTSQTSTTYTNGMPAGNNCTFVWASGSSFSIGNKTKSAKFTLGGSYEAGSYENEGGVLPSKETNKHHRGKNYIYLEGKLTGGSKNYNVTDDFVSMYITDSATYFAYNDKITVYLNSDLQNVYLTFTSKNKVDGTIQYFEIYDSDLFVKTTSGWYRSYKGTDTDCPVGFVLFNFDYDKNINDESLDCRFATISIADIISLGYSRSKYDSALAKAKTNNTNFIIGYTKTSSNKIIMNLYGDDNRRRLGQEMKICCQAFDIDSD